MDQRRRKPRPSHPTPRPQREQQEQQEYQQVILEPIENIGIDSQAGQEDLFPRRRKRPSRLARHSRSRERLKMRSSSALFSCRAAEARRVSQYTRTAVSTTGWVAPSRAIARTDCSRARNPKPRAIYRAQPQILGAGSPGGTGAPG